jgi:YfiH family protein
MLIRRASNLDAAAGIAHGFFGRTGGISEGVFASLNCGPGSSDDRSAVKENRARVARALGPGAALVTLYQVHSATAHHVTDPWPVDAAWDEVERIPVGDAMVTAAPQIALGILTADCAPVLLADPAAGVIGAAHAGWKGALSGVVEAAIAAMETLGARRRRIAAAIGPAIGQPNYEVGPELRDQFVSPDHENARYFVASKRPTHFQFDLEGYVADQLKRAGIRDIEPLSQCTYGDATSFFSFRRTTHEGGKVYGRQVSAIMLSGTPATK